MKINILFYLLLFAILAGCNHDHSNESGYDHESEVGHAGEQDHDHQTEEVPKVLITRYTPGFELFAEADVFIAGEPSHTLAHFTRLPSFKPLKSGRVTANLIVNGKEAGQTQQQPIRPGIYAFEIQPATAGKGRLIFKIESGDQNFEIAVDDITVFSDRHTAIEATPEHDHSETNTVVFTKEQSWKIDFATRLPVEAPFGRVVRTTGRIQTAPESRVVITAKTSGIVSLSTGFIVPGAEVRAGETLFTVSGSGMADNNIAVRYAQASNNYETAKLEYERMKSLATDKIVSEAQLLAAKNKFENARVKFENLQQHFDASGQKVSGPVSGFVDEVFVQNGAYIENGAPVLSVIDNQSLVLHADVRPKFRDFLGAVTSANIRVMPGYRIIQLEDFSSGEFIFGKATNTANYLIPVSIKLSRQPELIPGQFVELYLRAESMEPVIAVPNSSLLEEQGNFYVFVQINPELFEKRLIKAGATDGFKTMIKNGLSPDERIVTRGAMLIKLARATNTLDAHSGHVH